MILIDVRTTEEFSQGHAGGAINFPVERLSAGERPEIPSDQPIQVYCRSGNRAGLAKLILENEGYAVENLGGLSDIEKSGYKIVV